MKIAFSRINKSPYPFNLNLENVIFEGDLIRENSQLVKIRAKMKGFSYRICDRCGNEMELEINEDLELFASDGIFKDKENKLSDVMEFFDSHIDLIELAKSEFNIYLSDFFYCEKCRN